jgi:hypothetical protein
MLRPCIDLSRSSRPPLPENLRFPTVIENSSPEFASRVAMSLVRCLAMFSECRICSGRLRTCQGMLFSWE